VLKIKSLKDCKNVSILLYRPVHPFVYPMILHFPPWSKVSFKKLISFSWRKFSLNRMWKLYKNVIWVDNNFNDQLEMTWINVVKLCVNVLCGIFNGRTELKKKKRQISCLDQDSNMEPPERETGILTTTNQCST
jgi:hypothetical protein